MQDLVDFLLTLDEIKADRQALSELGLTQDEVDGCIEFFIENYFPPQKAIVE